MCSFYICMKIMALPIFEKFPPIEHISGKRDWLSDLTKVLKKHSL